MTIEERAAQAAQYKATGACNCTQAVIKVFEDKISTDEKELMELTAGFAAGMVFLCPSVLIVQFPPMSENIEQAE